LICGTLEPTSGNVIVNGRLAAMLELGSGFNPDFTGRENIYLNAAILGLTKEEINEKINQIIEFSEIGIFIDRPCKTYSSGMYMRLAFSLATAMHPDILVLDEIFSGGDAAFMQKAKSRMLTLINKANIMIMVSHDHELIKSLCNRVIWLDHGSLIADGTPENVVGRYLENKK
jgi:ABC-type polysaccharide/polyol phosphate transport system ATPase subunit